VAGKTDVDFLSQHFLEKKRLFRKLHNKWWIDRLGERGASIIWMDAEEIFFRNRQYHPLKTENAFLIK
jgi:hypothetical protein